MQRPASSKQSTDGSLNDFLRGVLAELAVRLEIPAESSLIQRSLVDSSVEADGETIHELSLLLIRAAHGLGIRLVPVELRGKDAWEMAQEGFVILDLRLNGGASQAWLYSNIQLGKIDSTLVGKLDKETDTISRQQMIRQIERNELGLYFVGEPSLKCESAATRGTNPQGTSQHGGGSKQGGPVLHSEEAGHDEHMSPQKRILKFLKLESRDIWSLVIFGFVVGVLDLATPLAVEQMVTTIGFASLTQPLIWLAILLFSILTLSAIIKGLQFFIVEILQRRMFVRIVGDLAERLPRLDRSAMDGVHGPEMANRFFDVMTMQKATASLLIEGLSLVIQTVTGLLLLALYSPFLLAFDIVLILCMTLFLLVLGRNAVRTAIDESIVKYRIAHWLQDVIGSPTAFQVHGAGDLVSERANRLTVEYLSARRSHFIVLMRQTFFSLMLYAISITSIMSLGVWLVLSGTLSMGQLVASVSVVALVVGAFAKIGKSLESYYDLMSAVDKVGHLIDLPTLAPSRWLDAGCGPVSLRIQNLTLEGAGHDPISVGSFEVENGSRFALTGEGECGKSMLMQSLCGLRSPCHGNIEIGGVDSRDVNRFADGSMVSIASLPEIFHGSLIENVSLNRLSIHRDDVRQALQTACLWDESLSLPNGLETLLQSGGYPLSTTQQIRLMIARAIAVKPRLLLVDSILDLLPPKMRSEIWQNLRDPAQPWTLVIATHCREIIEDCESFKELAHD